MNRRAFLQNALATTAASLLPAKWVFAENLPVGMTPLETSALTWNKASDLPDYYTVLNSSPLNATVPEHMLDPAITPANVPFVRWNGIMPDFNSIDPETWTFTVDGESVITSKTYTIAELKSKFTHHTQQLTLECGGNSRKGFFPGAKGNQWNNSAVYCSEWTGVLLSDVLKDCGIKDDAVYTGNKGFDTHLSGKGEAISRGVPIKAALSDNALIAWEMNGDAIPYLHGYPLRVVFGGRPASVSQKCAVGISVRNQVHDGHKMAAPAYQIPKHPIAPGEKVDNKDFKIIEEMIVKSLITFPETGTELVLGKPIEIRGHAWAGTREVMKVEVSYDYGAHWHTATLAKPVNKAAWQQWSLNLTLPQQGYYEIWAKATDDQGDAQPVVQPQWNPKGYMFNGCHRIAVRVA
ncbi:molybdopterin containing oxidoreductase [Photobacterium profundum]|uniref:Oxidoreductase, molybdopterin-binding n=1 Tax=Photobacterium profundum 3TCK TaxID=314280 RepID=Q1Z9U8_9GAMM|nr:sulfite oxidase [Photobacterium profundum]EAS45744.1 oxidoreductase, molybdopterin-binding [Photobacterium profundum 3TCK]PSV63118.1 molybdopterin containing oxidoreductase [Photobacterium profundum]